MRKSERLIIKVLPDQKAALEAIAQAEGEPVAVVLRRLIRNETTRRGLSTSKSQGAQHDRQD